jgi:Raf kinase inhibitor-like YbhB/YbcL family protein
MTMTLTSPAFAPGDPIPAEYTADGRDISPPLSWSGIPEGTKALALIVDDPDAPDPAAPKRVWVHWVLYNLPPTLDGLPAGVTSAQLPPGTLEGINDWERTGYGGPNPPIGRHRYFFKLYALDAPLPDLGKPTKTALVAAIAGHVLDRAELVGTYEKSRHG